MRLILVVVFALSVAAGAQSRRDEFTPENVNVTTTQLEQLPDAGCGVRWCGSITSDDGGTTLRACTDLVDLRMATNRARCDVLISAGGPRVLRELRFAVDAGVP